MNNKVNKAELASLYKAKDIKTLWRLSKNKPVISHPELGMISPNKLRSTFAWKPCPYCGATMVQGKGEYTTYSKKEAIDRGYRYINKDGKEWINFIEGEYFHPHYVTLDHKVNKARCPDLLFEVTNLEGVCFKCNQEKLDNNCFAAEKAQESISKLVEDAIKKYMDDV